MEDVRVCRSCGHIDPAARLGVFVGLDAHTGELLWDFKTDGRITGSPIVAGDTMYVVSHDGTLYAVARSE